MLLSFQYLKRIKKDTKVHLEGRCIEKDDVFLS